MRRNFFQIFALILILSFVSLAQNASLDDKLKEIDAYAQKVLTDWNAPGMAIAIVKDDKVVFAKGYGVRELGKPDKVDENTLFAIASNSKALPPHRWQF
jgi:CubicO group peptidase (beta-lactamase class C family)